MAFREWYQEEEKKRKEQITEKERKNKEEQLKEIEQISQLSKIRLDLEKLKDLIMNGIVEPTFVKEILQWEAIDDKQIEEIFEKIDEIESIKAIDKILPKELRISKEEYIWALNNVNQRIITLAKIDEALYYLYQSNWTDDVWGFNMFAWIFSLLNKNLQIVQWNYIDIKNDLESKKK